MKALSSGDYCKPKDEKEWNAILDIAQSLGVYGFGQRCRPFISHGWIWANNFSDKGELVVNECTSIAVKEVSSSDFIAGMYQLAEERKKPKCCEWLQANMRPLYPFFGGPLIAPMQDRIIGQISSLEKRVKGLEKEMSEKTSLLNSAFEIDKMQKHRLEKLEKVVSEEMGKDRVAQKINEHTWAEMYMRIRDAMGFDSSTPSSAAATTRMTNAYFGK